MSAAAGYGRAARAGPARLAVPLPVVIAIALAWALAITAEAAGVTQAVHHDALLHSGAPYAGGLLVFLLAWQGMTAAMMLPSSVPLVRLFATAAAGQPRPRAAMAAFLGGYAVVWSAFGAIAFSADFGIHHLVDAWPWLQRNDHLLGAFALALAGAFQFSSLKDACLRECRHPGAFLIRFYERGAGGGFRLGRRHGVFCLGCCWALMLVMFAAGVASLVWMAALTSVMVYEKTSPRGRRAVPHVGVAMIALALLVVAGPVSITAAG